MRILYSFIFYLGLPFIFIRLLLKGKINPEYLKRWNERLGKVSSNIPKGVVWFHCVSVGETIASVPMIQLFQKHHPELPLLVTTMTPGGSLQVKNRLKETVYHQYIPYDLPGIMSKFMDRIQPKCCILMETEIWPNLIYSAHQKNVPVLLANARLSEKSALKYARFRSFVAQIFSFITAIACQNKEDAKRFIQLGYPLEKMQVTGNIKFDIQLPEELINHAKALKKQMGDRLIWIAASTHPGEEEIMLEAAKKCPEDLLILVPRHPERRNEILAMAQKAQLKICLRSQNQWPDDSTKIFLIDTLGELILFYALSDIAFVGGSLINKGGHNLLEPAALGLPVLSGESLYNFSEIERLLDNAGALIKIKNADECAAQIKSLGADSHQREALGLAGKKVVAENTGATEKHLALIEKMLSH